MWDFFIENEMTGLWKKSWTHYFGYTFTDGLYCCQKESKENENNGEKHFDDQSTRISDLNSPFFLKKRF